MKKLLLIVICIITAAISFSSCDGWHDGPFEPNRYWCEYHNKYHYEWYICCDLRYCNIHGGWFHPEHWYYYH